MRLAGFDGRPPKAWGCGYRIRVCEPKVHTLRVNGQHAELKHGQGPPDEHPEGPAFPSDVSCLGLRCGRSNSHPILVSSLQENELPHLCESPGGDPAEVDTAGCSLSIPSNGMRTSRLVLVDQRGNPLAHCIVDFKGHL